MSFVELRLFATPHTSAIPSHHSSHKHTIINDIKNSIIKAFMRSLFVIGTHIVIDEFTKLAGNTIFNNVD